MKHTLVRLMISLVGSSFEFPGKWRIVNWLKNNKTTIIEMPSRKIWIDDNTCFLADPKCNFDVYINGFSRTPPVELIIRKYVKEGDTIIDVGANLGWTAILCSELVGENGSVHAFEPVPSVYKNLAENKKYARFENIKIYPFAVSDSCGVAELFLGNTNETTLASMRPHDLNDKGRSVRAEMITLDSLILDNQKISFVKIDVEGAEFKVLRGMASIIERDHPILAIELTGEWLEKFGDSSEQLIKFLTGFNYEIYVVSGGDFTPLVGIPSKQVDIACCPKKTSAE